jgi:UDP-glucose 4-epimerase
MRAFVTGGAGFIGSHLVDRLLSEGYQVTAFDNFSDGRPENITHLKANPKFKMVKGDIKDKKALEKVLRAHNVVFHMAAQANIRRSLNDHFGDLENNLVGTLNILEAMLRDEINDLVFASSSALYGEATRMPTPEEYAPIQTSLYGASKLACEAYAEAYAQFSEIKLWAYRFANVVGERCRRGVIWDFVRKLKSSQEELEILGDGRQSKEYIHVADCVDGMLTGYKKAKSSVNIFNLAVEDYKTVDEVATIVMEQMGLHPSSVNRRYTGGLRGWVGDNPIVHLDISRLKSLGWAPKFSAERAIMATAKWTIENSGPAE